MKPAALLLCTVIFSDVYGPLLNTPLRDVYTEVKVEQCSGYAPAVVVSARSYQEIQAPGGAVERHYLGTGERWNEVARTRLTVAVEGERKP